MTDARAARVVRVPGLRAAHQAIAALAGASGSSSGAIVLVPTAHAGRELLRTLRLQGLHGAPGERPRGADPALLPLTRLELLVEVHRRLGPTAPLVERAAREAMAWHASDQAIAHGIEPPFTVRPGLIAAMLDLYDGVRRCGRSIDEFERRLTAALEPGAETDRGAARLLSQTRYLAAVFRAYEHQLAASGLVDEHGIRSLAVGQPLEPAIDHLVLAIADQAAEPDGLWPADFDLLTRLPGLKRIDVVATEQVLDAGFRVRLFDWLPGIEEDPIAGPTPPAPTLIVPADRVGQPGQAHHLHRDREEELIAIARRLRHEQPASGDGIESTPARDADSPSPLDDVLVVYDAPLPYVYLARRVFEDAGLRFTTTDALPLAAEPYAAALDLVLDAALSGPARDPLLALLSSPMLTWRAGGRRLSPRDLEVLREWWRERRRGGSATPAVLADEIGAAQRTASGADRARLLRALRAAAAVADDLVQLDCARPLADHYRELASLLRAHDAAGDGRAADERHARARAATLTALDDLGDASARHRDKVVPFRDVVVLVRRALEARTFSPVTGEGGLRLCDARAARYAGASRVWLVGVNEGAWPAPVRRSIFYPSGLLRDLGFPPGQERQSFARAAFRDLVGLAGWQVTISAIQLEDDAIVRPSVLLEDLGELGLPTATASHELHPGGVPAGDGGGWPALRRARGPSDEPRFHGQAGPVPVRALSVTQIDRYLECPFKFFASVLLDLDEEAPRHEIGLSPRRRGSIVHQAFERFFRRWAAVGQAHITPALLPDARALWVEVVEEALAPLAEADRTLERMRLVGSAGTLGLGERVFRLEAVRPEPIVERLLEFDLRGTYELGAEGGTVALKGVADRIDLLETGRLRVIDYKTGRAPGAGRSIQLAVYALCAEQKLDGHRGRRWQVGEAAYLALGDRRGWVQVMKAGESDALADGRARLLAALGGIARGSFPPAPADRRSCRVCAFTSVCRKDYVDGAA
jgi:RecB family exonuclease